MKIIPPAMREAARLTRAGRLNEATVIIQKFLSGGKKPTSEPMQRHAALERPILDLVAADITMAKMDTSPSTPGKDHLATAKSSGDVPPASPILQTAETVQPPRKRAPYNVAPERGTFIKQTYGNSAGTRSFKLYIPSSTEHGPHPLIIMLHGCTQTADDFAAGTRMNFAAEEHACFVAYPEQVFAANPSKCWNWFEGGHQVRDRGEPSIIAGIVTHIMSNHKIDPRRVYIAGLSAGGAAAAVVAQAYPDVFAALGVHSGLACGVARDLPSALTAMQGRHPPLTPGHTHSIPTIVFHGDQDKTVHPRNGSDVIKSASAGESYVQEVEKGNVQSGRSYVRSILREPDGKAMIEDWVIHGAGHAWSGGNKAGSFTDPLGPDATREMLRFFLEHQRAP